jgi:hypothetical protein
MKIHIYGQVTVYVKFGVVFSNIEHSTTSIALLADFPTNKEDVS